MTVGSAVDATIAAIPAPDVGAARAARAALDQKTKPRGSLARLERIARQVAAIRGSGELAPLDSAIVVVAADHGVADAGVSAYPPEVTRQMVANFANGGAAINVLARRAGAQLLVVDAGLRTAFAHPRVKALRIGDGTANFVERPAMTRSQAADALSAGIELAGELAARDVGIVALGEMGIGNTTAAAAICSGLLERDAREVCGRGTGVDDAGLARKVGVVRSALRIHQLDGSDPVAILAAVGGFEIGVLAGLALGCAAQRVVVVLDGFITGTAALVAARLAPNAVHAMIAAHRSPEPGHALVLAELGLEPLLDLGLRLGEGSGAALALPLVQAALAIASEMATFDAAGVTDAGR
jgi:nicotinate-nucleotide--dimethylbenzimidazole phosphoribosyltransferase